MFYSVLNIRHFICLSMSAYTTSGFFFLLLFQLLPPPFCSVEVCISIYLDKYMYLLLLQLIYIFSSLSFFFLLFDAQLNLFHFGFFAFFSSFFLFSFVRVLFTAVHVSFTAFSVNYWHSTFNVFRLFFFFFFFKSVACPSVVNDIYPSIYFYWSICILQDNEVYGFSFLVLRVTCERPPTKHRIFIFLFFVLFFASSFKAKKRKNKIKWLGDVRYCLFLSFRQLVWLLFVFSLFKILVLHNAWLSCSLFESYYFYLPPLSLSLSRFFFVVVVAGVVARRGQKREKKRGRKRRMLRWPAAWLPGRWWRK